MTEHECVELVAALHKSAEQSALLRVEESMKGFNEMLTKLQKEYADQKQLMASIRYLANDFGPINEKACQFVNEMGGFAQATVEQYIKVFEKALDMGKWEMAQKMIVRMLEHLAGCKKKLSLVLGEYEKMSVRAKAVASDAATQATEANKKIEANKSLEENAANTGHGGLATECIGAVVLVSAGSNPVGWGLLLGGAAVGLSGYGTAIHAKYSADDLTRLERSAKDIQNVMTKVNGAIQLHFKELTDIESSLVKASENIKFIQVLAEDKGMLEMVKCELPSVKKDFEALHATCQRFEKTEAGYRAETARQLGLER